MGEWGKEGRVGEGVKEAGMEEKREMRERERENRLWFTTRVTRGFTIQ